jgi:hypothetical protein
MAKREWLQDQHPLFKLREGEWRRNERRLRGGVSVLPELRRFDWETPCPSGTVGEFSATLDAGELSSGLANKDKVGTLTKYQPGEHYTMRQSQAMYVNFPDAFMAMLTGHLFRKRPTMDKGLSFGSLGKIRPERVQANPTNAELVFYNTDGVGNDGSQWDTFWADVTRWAGATGHRWVFTEASVLPGVTQRDVFEGKRPYLTHISPLDIYNWDFENGRLSWAIQNLPPKSAVLGSDGKLDRANSKRVRLYVRKGFTGFDADGEIIFSGGGWWTFDSQGTVSAEPGDVGTWDGTKGAIPMWVHYYERDKDRMSRCATTELGNAAVAYMNLDSAASFDAWDAASSLQFLLGVDPQAFEVAMEKILDGSKYIPVPSSGEPGTTKVVPTVQDSSAGAVTADVFTKRMSAIRETVREVTGLEVSGTPNSSGASKDAGFGEGKAPRLALLASEVEASQNIAIFFLEQRFGSAAPQGSSTWTRDFDLAPVLDSIERLFDLQKTSGLMSPTMSAKLMMIAAKESGTLTSAEDQATIESEFTTSAEAVASEQTRMATINAEFGRGAGTPAPGSAADPSALPPKAPDQVIQTTTDTVLNGAQIAAAVEIVTLVAEGTIPRNSGIAMLEAFFNIVASKAEQIMGDAGNGAFKPTPKAPPVGAPAAPPAPGAPPPTPPAPAAGA